MDDQEIQARITAAVEQFGTLLRQEYTVMPRFGYHQPLDYDYASAPRTYGAPVTIEGELLPLPAPADRMGYSADNEEYLTWGKHDHDLIVERIRIYSGELRSQCKILDFGCSTGRVLRHFEEERKSLAWKPMGIDVQASCSQWIRENFPSHYEVATGTVMPHLPYEDNSIDFIYGFSVFTHIKYLWDAWLLELRRVLKPDGLLLQTIHAESAWQFYHRHRNEEWVSNALPVAVYGVADMNVPYFYHGDISNSQVFWKAEVARNYWSRYFTVLDVLPPAAINSFQDMVICRKST